MDPEETDDMLAELTGGNERERVVGAGAGEVVAKLGAAAAARAGSNRSSDISSSTSVWICGLTVPIAPYERWQSHYILTEA